MRKCSNKEKEQSNIYCPSKVVECTPQHHETISIAANSPQLQNLITIFVNLLKSTTYSESIQDKIVTTLPMDLVAHMRAAIESSCEQPSAPEFKFELSHNAANHNAKVLKWHKFNLGIAINANFTSPLGYGSEFRPTSILRPIFQWHLNWSQLHLLLTNWSIWPLDELDKEKRKQEDVEDALTFSNHKGATSQPELLWSLTKKDIKNGIGLVIPLSLARQIPGTLLAPMNITKQNTINEQGKIIPKDRLTHDQSFPLSSGPSVNSRVQVGKLLPCRFGGCICRIANYAIAAHRIYPNRRIYATKTDYKLVYLCFMQLTDKKIEIILLSLTFGGTPGPYKWSVLSKIICDLANALLLDNNWDLLNLHAPAMRPPIEPLPYNLPFGIGQDLIVDLPIDPRGKIDCCIDDTIRLTINLLDADKNWMAQATLLALHATSRPVHDAEPIKRNKTASNQN